MRLWPALLAPLLLVAAPASADNSALQEARALTSEATIEYNVGRFEQALNLYTKAYERLPKPALLFNLGQCQRQLGHHERALFFFHGYLREKPDAPNRALVEQLIEDSQRQLDAQREAEAHSDHARNDWQAAEAQSRLAQAAEAQKLAAEAAARNAPPAAPTPAAPSASRPPAATEVSAPASPPSSSFVHVAGFALAGAGVLAVGAGVYAGLRSASLANQISTLSTQQGTWSPQYQSDYDSGKSLATVANVLYVSGAAAIATGIVLAWVGWPKSAGATASLAPLPGGASIDLVGRF